MAVKTDYRLIKEGFSLSESALSRWIAAHEPHSAVNSIPLTWERAEDCSVWDAHGNRFIDLTSGIFVANAGHANQKIRRAIEEQLEQPLVFAYNYPTEIKKRFMERLLALSPSHFDAMTLLNSGSEAMDTAYKLIKLYGKSRNKRYVISFTGNYHGRGLSNDLISGGKERANWSGITDPDVVFLDFPYKPDAEFNPSLLPPLDQIAGFIIETFQGWGAWFYPREFLTDLAVAARKAGALICFDEMQSGAYRLGPLYGYSTYGAIEPDIVCLGKGVTSSLPLSIVLSRKELFDIDPHADLHSTHSGNALCAAAALANIDFLSSPEEIARREKTVPLFEESFRSLSEFPAVTQVNARGLIAGIIFERTEDATVVVHECINRGVLPVCTNRNAIKVAPPLTMQPDMIREAVEVFREVLESHS